MGTIITIGQFILSLSILIILHECGHFFPAKWFKTKVEKFYLFFDPWFSLVKFKKGETEYGLGWLPFGGYVKIAGMIDESFDKEQMAGPPQPWEFRSKPAWQRLIIMIGGVTVNFILGILLFSFIFFNWGETTLPNANAVNGIQVEELGLSLGLENGDQLVKVGDVSIKNMLPNPITKEIVINEAREISVIRNGKEITLTIADSIAQGLSSYQNKDKYVLQPRIPVKVGQIAPESNAEKAGLRADDQILTINGQSTYFYDQFAAIADSLKGQDFILGIKRNTDTIYMETAFTPEGKLGFLAYDWRHFYDTAQETFGVGQSLQAGWNRSVEFLTDQLKAFGQMFRGKMKVQESVGGPITIATMFGPTWNWQQFWNLTASLSIILAFMNLLPIPGLDGGHVLFLLWELITGKKASDRIVEYATMVGFFLLIGLMVAIFWIDIARLF